MQVGLDYTLFIQIIQFLIIVLIVNKLIIIPVSSAILNRDAKIKNYYDKASDISLDLENRKKAHELKMIDFRKEISSYQDKRKIEADLQAQKITDEAKTKAGAMTKAAYKDIQDTTEEARKELGSEIDTLAEQIASLVDK